MTAILSGPIIPTPVGHCPTRKPTNEDIEALEGELLNAPDLYEAPVVHRFAPGLYMREIHVPAGKVMIGHLHKEATLNVMLKGRISVLVDGEVHELVAPCSFVSAPGVRKVAAIHEDLIFANIHPNPTNETDLQKLEELFITKSDTFLQHAEEMKALQSTLEKEAN